MRTLSKSRPRSRLVDLDIECAVPDDDLAQLRHRVLNDYQAVIACIFEEGAAATSPEVKEALSRVADCIHELASSLRHPGSDSHESKDPSFDFGSSKA